MGFTDAQRKEMSEKTQQIHKSLYTEVVNELNSTMRNITLPNVDNVDDEYKDLFTKLNQFCGTLNKVSKAGVSGDFMSNYKNESIISQCFDFGPILRDGIENDLENELDDDDEANDELASERINVTLDSIINALDRIMAKNNGEAMENTDIQSANMLINTLANFKIAYSVRRLAFRATQKKIKVDMVKQNIYIYDNAVKEHIKEVQKHIKAKIDYEHHQEELKRAKEALALIESNIEREERLLASISANDKEIGILAEENSNHSEKMQEASKELTNLSLVQTKIDELISHCKDKSEALELLHTEIHKLDAAIKNNERSLNETVNDINSEAQKVQELKSQEDEILSGNKYTDEQKEIIRTGYDLAKEVEKSQKICDALANKGVNALVKDWLDDFDGETTADLEKQFERKLAILGGVNNPKHDSYLQARSVIESLVFDGGMTPKQIKEAFSKDNAESLLKAKQEYVAEGVKVIDDLGENSYHDKEGFYDILSSLTELNNKINASNENIKNLGILAGELTDKIDREKQMNDELKAKAKDNGVAKWVNDSYTILKELSKMPLIKSQITDEFAEKLNSLSSEELKENASAKDYEKHLSKLAGVGEELNKILENRKKEVNATVNELAVKVAENEQKIEKIKSDINKDQLEYITKLKWAKEHEYEIIGELDKSSNEQKNLLEWHKRLRDEVLKNSSVAGTIVPELDKNFMNSIFGIMLSKYRQLNDSRIWRGNSPEYENMISPLCKILGLGIPAFGENLKNAKIDGSRAIISKEKIIEELKKIKENAEEYLDQKDENSKWKDTAQKKQRITMAKNLIAMCKEVTKGIESFKLVAKDFIPVKKEFDEAAKNVPPIKPGEKQEEAYGKYLNDVASGNEVKQSYDVPNKDSVKNDNLSENAKNADSAKIHK